MWNFAFYSCDVPYLNDISGYRDQEKTVSCASTGVMRSPADDPGINNCSQSLIDYMHVNPKEMTGVVNSQA
ncbi:hypothetical protein NECAME_15347 [Necator americanus]|uniref:Uncharacterized protein n=1 Tax=Necator americanus TaxID=51031 RepID=W2SKK4_NECAM|nr:hypothetical protein NECAME_15347 [Necator americanus]ETN69376.1 hypothetical protein NECAME_15347 [Necator americanus]